MKKILISLALVLFMSIGVYAQLTPEGVMATLPDLPTLAQMIAYETEEQDPDLYSDFHAKLSDAQKQCQEMVDKTTASLAHDVKSQAMKEKVPGTNVSVAQAKTRALSTSKTIFFPIREIIAGSNTPRRLSIYTVLSQQPIAAARS